MRVRVSMTGVGFAIQLVPLSSSVAALVQRLPVPYSTVQHSPALHCGKSLQPEEAVM